MYANSHIGEHFTVCMILQAYVSLTDIYEQNAFSLFQKICLCVSLWGKVIHLDLLIGPGAYT